MMKKPNFMPRPTQAHVQQMKDRDFARIARKQAARSAQGQAKSWWLETPDRASFQQRAEEEKDRMSTGAFGSVNDRTGR